VFIKTPLLKTKPWEDTLLRNGAEVADPQCGQKQAIAVRCAVHIVLALFASFVETVLGCRALAFAPRDSCTALQPRVERVKRALNASGRAAVSEWEHVPVAIGYKKGGAARCAALRRT
jgi:hypothetical protein